MRNILRRQGSRSNTPPASALLSDSNDLRARSTRCWEILPKVSRSFAMVIRWLPGDVGESVMVSYLLCRITDTIEDSSLPPREKRPLLQALPRRLESGRLELPDHGVSETYGELLARADDVMACYRRLGPEARLAIQQHLEIMCAGMARWCDREIETLSDQNEYCYSVAGVVGELLTELFHVYGLVDASRKNVLERHAVDFGLGLQKINILRDVRADLAEGRCYWPLELMARHGVSRQDLLKPGLATRSVRVLNDLVLDVLPYLQSAVRYVAALPLRQSRLRTFCAIPLYMAVATAALCRSNPQVLLGPKPVKISSFQVRTILARIVALGWFNPFLKRWYRAWEREILLDVNPPLASPSEKNGPIG